MQPQNVSSALYNRLKEADLRRNNTCRHSPGLTKEEEENLAETFPCQNPRNPDMSDFHKRHETFRTWPSHVMKATTTELADAGFIYLKSSDRLKCYYCNGGLQHWQYHESPWFEHAKWYPNCDYLLRKRGISYVHSVVEQFPHINRPKLIAPQTPINIQNSSPTSGFSNISSPPTRNPIQGVRLRQSGIIVSDEISSSSSSSACSFRKSLTDAMKSFVVQQAIEMSFDKDLIEKVVKRKLDRDNAEYTTVLSIVDDLVNEETAKLNEETAKSSTSSEEDHMEAEYFQASDFDSQNKSGFARVQTSVASSVQADSTEVMQDTSIVEDRIQHIKTEDTCKVCMDRKINSVFLPCGHLCCCMECSAALKQCPICRKKLEKIVKFYRDI